MFIVQLFNIPVELSSYTLLLPVCPNLKPISSALYITRIHNFSIFSE